MLPSLSLELSLKLQLRSVQENPKPAVGAALGALAVTVLLTVSLRPLSSVTVRVTL